MAKSVDSITVHVSSSHIARPPRPCRTLADDVAMIPHAALARDDDDMELCTWPDWIDQRMISDPATAFCGAFADDDMETDDGV